jgi:hypothetical protein
MKKILASIIEYKLTKINLSKITQQLSMKLDIQDPSLPETFAIKMYELLANIRSVSALDSLSEQDEELVMDTLKEMELVLVDYLTQVSSSQTNDCFFY